MNALQNATNFIKRRIPKEILNLAFMTKVGVIGKITNIESQIESLVLKPIVLVDINLMKGVTYTIELSKCKQYHIQYNITDQYMVIEVPYALTGNKEIIDALSMTYSPINSFSNANVGFGSNGGLSLASSAMDAVDPNAVSGVVTSNLQLIGPNTILVHESILGGIGGYLRISVENDESFNNLKPKSILAFRELCLLATKAYIYNEFEIEMSEGVIYGGHNLDTIKDKIDSYESAAEDYDEFIKTKMRKVLFINDFSYSRYVKMLVTPIT